VLMQGLILCLVTHLVAVEMEKLLVARDLAQEDDQEATPHSPTPSANGTDQQATLNMTHGSSSGPCKGGSATQGGVSWQAWAVSGQQDSSTQQAGAVGRSVPGAATRAYAGCQALIGTLGLAFMGAAVKFAET
jgi:hypothetical protein